MNNNLAYSHLVEVEQKEVLELGEENRAEVMSFLAQDPVQTVILRGLILDYGLCGAELRGRFYGYFANEQLAGVALIGHQIIVFGADEALPYFARKVAEVRARGYLMLGPQAIVEALWNHLSKYGRETKRVNAHRLYVCQPPSQQTDHLQLLRANYAELDVIVDAKAEMVLEESGTDPRLDDAAGFRHRVAERIEQKRIWVKIEDGKVVFKADLFSNTPDTVYLEGIWVHPDYRRRGIAKSCMKELVQRLLSDHQTICLLTNEEEKVAQNVYEQVGFVYVKDYEARFLMPLA
jgi:uncharacterized protein